VDAVTWVYIVIEVAAALGLISSSSCTAGRVAGCRTCSVAVSGAAQGSTVVERNLDRITVTVAIIFTFTTLTLDLRLQ